MKQTIFTGAGTAIITPMKNDMNINYEKMEELLNYQIENHTDAIIVAGTTGEASTLTDQEHYELVKFTVDCVKHRVPVIAGAGSNCTQHAVELSRQMEKAGADALLQVTPYYNKTSQAGLVKHFFAIADATKLPIILYNIPSRTGMNIQPQTYLELCKNDKIAAVKEASGNFSQIAKISSLCEGRLDIYTGNDDQITSALALGAKGAISVLSNILPQLIHDICDSFFHNHHDISDELQIENIELIEALFYDVNPIPVKQAMNYMGMEVGECRLPLCEMEPVLAEKLLKVLKKYKLLDGDISGQYEKRASILHERNMVGAKFH